MSRKITIEPLRTEERNDDRKLTQNYSEVIKQVL